MSFRPILRPDADNELFSQHDGTSDAAAGSPDPAEEVSRFAKALSDAGGGPVSYDLALDLALNEIVGQARELSRATGAAIALTRDQDMICRATTGNAPELGTRVDTASGLSAAALRTGTVQHCTDTERDPRVDVDACRQLQLRSMLLIPIFAHGVPFGLLEVFSSLPDNFSDGDVKQLELLAEKISAAKKAADQGAKPAPTAEKADPEQDSVSAVSPVSRPLVAEQDFSHLDSVLSEQFPKSEILTSGLVVLVITVALLLGVVIGVRRTAQPRTQKDIVAAPPRNNSVQSQAAPIITPVAPDTKQAAPVLTTGKRTLEAPVGGLVVTQNGKVIYRADPSTQNAVAPNADGPTSSLLHRVDPQYPDAARSQRIEGPVVLDAQVLGDGSVGRITIVQGDPLLAQAATNAVKQWKYQPYTVRGRQPDRWERITVKFTLPAS